LLDFVLILLESDSLSEVFFVQVYVEFF